MSVSESNKLSFFGNVGVLCFLETPFLRFAYLPYYRRVQVCFESMLDLGFERKDCGKFIKVLEIDLLESRTLSIWRR